MKKILFLIFCFAMCTAALADDFTRRAQQHFEWLQTGKADSVLLYSTPQVKAQLKAAALNQIWAQLQAQGGKLTDVRPWKVVSTSGYHVCERILVFERARLQLNIVLSPENLLAGLNFVPAPAEEEETTAGSEQEEADDDSDDVAFTERDCVVKHGQVELPGTLTIPAGEGERWPVVILVHGSGPQDRDETIGPNAPFRNLAHGLALRGIAVVRYDKRTKVYGARTAEVSGGKLNLDTEAVDDALAAARLVAQLPEIDAEQVYIVGHSMGGTLVPRMAERARQEGVKLAGVVGIAALARPFEQAVESQLAYIAETQGTDCEQARKQAAEGAKQMMSQLPESYRKALADYNATRTAAGLGAYRMLFVQGGHDYQVTKEDLDLWKAALGANPQAEFAFFPSLDHFLRSLPEMAKPNDYRKPGTTAPEAIDRIAAFVLDEEP